jgi:cysteine desulfurase
MAPSPPVYLDNHSTTRLDPRVLEAMLPWLTDHYGNAGSVTHEPGRLARERVDQAREAFAAAIGATAAEIVFTSGATESNNLALLGTARRRRNLAGGESGGHVVTVVTEHDAVLDPCTRLEREGVAVTRLPVEPQASGGIVGRVRLDDLEASLRPDTFLVSVMLANNEIGVVQDIPAIAERVHAGGALLHVDCAQAVGRMQVDMAALDADLASFSAHKFHGPKGTGALWLRRRGRVVRVEPLVHGGGQERGMRSGTLDVPGIVGMAEAARLGVSSLPADAAALRQLRDRLWGRLRDAVDGIALNGPPLDAVDAAGTAVRLPNNLNVRVAGVDGQSLLAALSAVGLAASSGSACSSAQPRPSHVLLALGLDEDEARASLRFGLSRFTTADEIDAAVARVAAGVTRLRELA